MARADDVRLTMWDWSWLSHHVPGGGFADWRKVLAEARERGFDTIRFDPLPDLVAIRDGVSAPIRVPATDQAVPWIHVPAEQVVDPLAATVAFATAAVAEGHRLILSTWALGRGRRPDDTVDFGTYPALNPLDDDDAALEQLLAGWRIVLDELGRQDVLDHVAYVDLNNELDLVVALSSSRVGALRRGADPWDWSGEQGPVFREIAERGIEALHREYPDLLVTASCCGDVEVIGPWFPRNADVLEWHAWYDEPGDQRRQWKDRVAELFPGGRVPEADDFATPERRARLSAVYRRAHLAADAVLRPRQDAYLAAVKRFADDRCLRAYLGEGYATAWYSDEPELAWDWVKDVSAAAARTVRALGYAGFTTSNFSEPTFPLWADVDWHRELLLP